MTRFSTTLRAILGAACAGLLGSLVGCVADYSQPRLSITEARVNDLGAEFDLHIVNQGGIELRLNAIEYSVEYGVLPVADGQWTGSEPLPAGGSLDLALPVEFEAPPMGAGPDFTLVGMMRFDDRSNFGSMRLKSAAFEASAPANR